MKLRRRHCFRCGRERERGGQRKKESHLVALLLPLPHTCQRPRTVVDNSHLGPLRHGFRWIPFLSGHVARKSDNPICGGRRDFRPPCESTPYTYIYIYVCGRVMYEDTRVVNNAPASDFISYMLMNNLVTNSVPPRHISAVDNNPM